MTPESLTIHDLPRLTDGRMVLGFSGWMDGGEVSTGSVRWLIDTLEAQAFAEIDAEPFSIYNFPGSMEISALFRPHVEIASGRIEDFEAPSNVFYADASKDLILFVGKEPNLNWSRFAECIFHVAAQANVTSFYFIGSFGGLVPHTREPRLIGSYSSDELRSAMTSFGLGETNYEGPASFASYLMTQVPRYDIRMASIVAEIPAYVESANPKCIEAVMRKLVAILGLQVDLEDLRKGADKWERRINRVLERKPDLAQHIDKLEEDYDNEIFDTQMGDLKAWLERQGIRVD